MGLDGAAVVGVGEVALEREHAGRGQGDHGDAKTSPPGAHLQAARVDARVEPCQRRVADV
jgi:hypothetical protein